MPDQPQDVNDIFANIDEKVNIIFRYLMLMNVYQAIPREYETGFFMSEVDIHTLSFIEKNPGITAKKICQYTYRTKGTVSTMLAKLEKDGYLEQRVNPDNLRERNLYLTEKGQTACTNHTAFDRKTTVNYLLAASEVCSPEEINGYFKMTQFRSDYFEKVIQKEKERYAEVRKNLPKEIE